MIKQIEIDVQIKSKKWSEIKNLKIKNICAQLIVETELKKFLQKKSNRLEMSVSLVSDAQIKKINNQFRGKNKPTDVLSFSFLDEKLIRSKGLKEALCKHSQIFLGDIILSFETIKKEALKQNKNFSHHLTHLILHSILHLIGYDHENKKDAKIMEEIEIKILKKFGIKNPYTISR